MPLKIIFCGTPEFAVPSLVRLAGQTDFDVTGVISQPDRPSGRGGAILPTPVKAAAERLGIPIFQPLKIKSDPAIEYFEKAAPDVVVIIAYGQIISPRLIAIPRLGWINVHGSLLPKYRGAAPIHWAIASGDSRTGLTTMQVEAGLDTGPTLLRYETAIAPDETSPQLYARLADAAAPLIVETLQKLEAGTLHATPQDNTQATLARPLKKEDGRIDWRLSSTEIYNRMRAFQPWPGAFTTFRGKGCSLAGKPDGTRTFDPTVELGEIFTVGSNVYVACGSGTALQIESVQLEGRKRVPASEFASGARLVAAEKFGG